MRPGIDTILDPNRKTRQLKNISLSAGLLVTFLLGILFQTKHTLLYDYSYLVNISGRFLTGELPYRDFDLVVSPGIFLAQSLFFKIFGPNSFSVLLLALTIVVSCYLLTTSIIVNYFLPKFPFAQDIKFYLPMIVLATSLLGLNWIVSFPIYDALGTLFILFNIKTGLSLLRKPEHLKFFLFGLSLSLPFFAKQSIGLGYSAGGILFIIVASLKIDKTKEKKLTLFGTFILGLISFPALFYAYLEKNSLLELYLYQNFEFAGRVKGITITSIIADFSEPTFLLLLIVSYCSIMLNLKKVRYLLQVAPLILGGALAVMVTVTTLSLGIYNFSHINWPLVIWIWILAPLSTLTLQAIFFSEISLEEFCVATLLAFGLTCTYLSHGYKGSSYATGPLFALACALLCCVTTNKFRRIGYIGLASTLAIAVWFPIYAYSAHRYASPNFAKQSYSFHNLPQPVAYLAIPTKTQSDVKDLIAVLKNAKGSILQLPAEDPIFLLAPSSTPWSRCVQLHFVTCTLSDEEILKKFTLLSPDYLIFKKKIQLEWNPEPISQTIFERTQECFSKILENETYQVFKKKSTQEVPVTCR